MGEQVKLDKAANELEDIATIAKQMVTDLREGKPNAYGRVYWLRKQLSYTVARLGAGVPKGLDKIETEYEKQLPLLRGPLAPHGGCNWSGCRECFPER